MSRKLWVVMGLVVSLFFAMTIPAMAQNATPQAPKPIPAPITASTSLFATPNFLLNVRSGPGRQYTILGLVRTTDALDITGKLENESWLRVNFNGLEGWISAPLVEVTGDLTIAPETLAGASAVLRQTANQAVTAQLGTVVVITRVNANLRALPSVNADVLVVMPFNTTLMVLGRTANNNWVRVTFNDQTGWVSSGTLIFSQGNIVNAQTMDENGNAIQATPEPTVVPTASA